MRIVQRVLSRREKVRQLTSSLELLRAKSEVSEDEYQSLTADYGSLAKDAELNVEEVRNHLREREQALREGRRQLEEEIRQLDLRQKVGELTAMQADRARRRTQGQLDTTDRKLLKVEGALNAQSSADVGGYVDVDVRARVEPSAGMLGDELDAPEIVGAAQESIKEWQGRAREWAERSDLPGAAGKVLELGERAKTRMDEAAARGADAINRKLEKRGARGISANGLKVAVAILVLILFFFFFVAGGYPETPAEVLETAWASANSGSGEDVEPYLSLLTVDWMRESLALMPGKDLRTLLREKWSARTHQQTVDHLEVTNEQVREKRATVEYRVHYKDGTVSAPRTQQFVREAGQWKLESRFAEVF